MHTSYFSNLAYLFVETNAFPSPSHIINKTAEIIKRLFHLQLIDLCKTYYYRALEARIPYFRVERCDTYSDCSLFVSIILYKLKDISTLLYQKLLFMFKYSIVF